MDEKFSFFFGTTPNVNISDFYQFNLLSETKILFRTV